MENVAVAMSGGVDSSVAAATLKEKGHQVIGITMQVCPGDEADSSGFIDGARRVADALGIPHHVVDLRDIFQEKIITPFCEEYATGRTPNPCVWCNRYIKFDALFQQARSLGARYIATGHHARVTMDSRSGRALLQKGVDRAKDQSYFLHALTQEQLNYALFPIGHLTKEEVRAIAREKGLPISSRPESQDICFIPDNDYARFLRDLIPQAFQPGPILDERGNILGRHQGIINYTIGQRKGLGIAASKPLYVIAIKPEHNAVIVGGKESALSDNLVATNVNWLAIDHPTEAITATAKIRYRHPEAAATITPIEKNTVYVKFKRPQLAITPGQAVVFYNGDIVLGGGKIKSSGKLKGYDHIG
jgi:tRNA-specific 2-thiouridylase